MAASSFAELVCCSSSPHVRDKLRINLEDAASKFHSRLLNPTDAYTSTRAAERVTKKGGDAAKHGKHEEALNLGLGSLEDVYEYDRTWKPSEVASGYGRKLQRYIHIKTRTPRAVLTIKKAKIPSDFSRHDVWKQLEHMCKLDHPNIVPFRECFEDQQHLRLVYDWCQGGPLMTQLWRYEEKLTECHVAQIFQEILGALGAAHDFGIQHLDLGLLLIFLDRADQLSPIKVFGVGLAGFMIPAISSRAKSMSNKHFYAAPELLNTRIKNLSPSMRHACDVWAVGAMLYTICAGRPPFGIEDKEKTSEMALRQPIVFGLEFCQYSSDLPLCIEQLMTRPWKKRPSARDALQHRWFGKARTLHLAKDGQISSIALRDLNAFVAQDHARQTLARLLGDLGLNDELYPDLMEKFRELDLDCDGTLTLEELKDVASALPDLAPESVDQIMSRLDRNGNGNVDVSEFAAALVMHQSSQDERLMMKAFDRMDKNGDARVTKKELFGILRQYSTTIEPKEVSTFVSNVDQDGDKKFDYREFTSMFPHVKERAEALDTRFNESRGTIAVGQACLNDFKEVTEEWKAKMVEQKQLFEVAGGKPRADTDTRAKYSYPAGHFSEFELHAMLIELLELIEDVPGYQLTKELMRIRRSNQTRILEKSPEQKRNETPVLGAQTLLMEREKKNIQKSMKKEGVSKEKRASVQVSDLVATIQNKKDAGIEQWADRLEKDRKDRRKDPEYQPTERMYENLYWLVKVKCDLYWHPPLQTLLKDLQNACVEDIRQYTLEKTAELEKMQAALTEEYKMLDDTEFANSEKIFKIKKESRLLPMGSFRGAELTDKKTLDGIKHMHPPVLFVFALPKLDITREKIHRMREAHTQGCHLIARVLSEIVKSLEDLFKEVAEQMTGSMEARLPCPPRISHLYLKHCQGREIQRDAATPRSNETDSEDEALPSPRHQASEAASVIHHAARIERNFVLKKAARTHQK